MTVMDRLGLSTRSVGPPVRAAVLAMILLLAIIVVALLLTRPAPQISETQARDELLREQGRKILSEGVYLEDLGERCFFYRPAGQGRETIFISVPCTEND